MELTEELYFGFRAIESVFSPFKIGESNTEEINNGDSQRLIQNIVLKSCTTKTID